MLFLSDLDNTLIFSYKRLSADNFCVEKTDCKNLSYMTNKGAELFEKMTKKVIFVPVTTRSLEQYNRIVFPNGYLPEYAIADNGANLLIKGIPDPEWHSSFREIIEDSMGEIKRAENFLKNCPNVYFDIRFVDGAFLFTKTHFPEDTARELISSTDPIKTSVFTNGDKLYVIPREINKMTALKKLRDMLCPNLVIAAGDSLFDMGMLLEADIAVIKKGELSGMDINPRQIAEEESDPDFVLKKIIEIIS